MGRTRSWQRLQYKKETNAKEYPVDSEITKGTRMDDNYYFFKKEENDDK